MPTVEFMPFQPSFGLELVKLWRASFQRAMGLVEQNRWEEVEDQLRFFMDYAPENIQVAMTPNNSALVGFMVLEGRVIEQLYVHVDHQGQGLGAQFFQRAKAISPSGLELYTFQKNVRAQAFYDQHGFVEAARGFARAEDNPWAENDADLADVMMLWVPGT